VTPYQRLRRHYLRAAETDRVARGRQWYPEMRRRLDTARGEHGLDAAIAVFSITSQGAQLRSNLDWTERALAGDCYVGRFPKAQAPKIRAALESPEVAHEVARGPKIAAFRAAVAGDSDSLVLDRWALFAALGPDHDRDSQPTQRQRASVIRAYHKLAAEMGESVRDLQAIIWLQVRETTPHAKLWDITHD
jgi:hypothetical protein